MKKVWSISLWWLNLLEKTNQRSQGREIVRMEKLAREVRAGWVSTSTAAIYFTHPKTSSSISFTKKWTRPWVRNILGGPRELPPPLSITLQKYTHNPLIHFLVTYVSDSIHGSSLYLPLSLEDIYWIGCSEIWWIPVSWRWVSGIRDEAQMTLIQSLSLPLQQAKPILGMAWATYPGLCRWL